MKRIIILITVMMTPILSCNSQILWRIEKDHAHVSYLFGTFHLAPISFCSEVQSFTKVFSDCSQVLGEVSYFEKNENKRNMNYLMPANRSLNELYKSEDYELIISYFESVYGSRPGAITFSPSGLLLFIINSLYHQAIPELSDQEMDYELQKMALNDGKNIRGLVSYEEHINDVAKLLDGDLNEQAKTLLDYIKLPNSNPDMLRQQLNSFYQAYKRQDLSQIEKYADLFSSLDKGEELLIERNKKWLPTIVEAVNTYPTFIVVGAGHLVGKDGLINMLINCGYRMTPVE